MKRSPRPSTNELKRSPLSGCISYFVCLWVLLVGSSRPVVAAEQPAGPDDAMRGTWTDPEAAAADDPDFLTQGEYGKKPGEAAWGVQVVALGGGEFDAYLLEGGLPGWGWTPEKQRIKLHGHRKQDAVQLVSSDGDTQATIVGTTMTIACGAQRPFDLPKLERQSPTLGATPPKDAVILFDGTSADAWLNGRVEGGLLPNDNVTTRQKFHDYTLHLEFRTPYKPYARGQARGNSGVYHQGRYETQVLDSFGLEGRANEAGGIYSIAPPLLNMCLPPLTWQTYDIDFVAARFDTKGELTSPARITVRLNGTVVHADQELPHTTTAAPVKQVTPEPGPLYLQQHRNPVYYRNIWLVPR